MAIANEGGGQFILGVADALPRPVVGTNAFPDSNAIAEKLFTRLGFRVDVEAVDHPDGRVVVFHIPSRPRGTAYHLDGKYLMRSGEETVPMSEDQLRRIFAEGQPDWLEEASRTLLTAQDVVHLLDTQTYFEMRKLPYPTDRSGVLDRLEQDRLIEQSSDGTLAVRRIGALLLAKRMEDFPDVARKASRLVVYSGSSKINTALDHISEKGYAVGFRDFIQFVMAQLPQNEVIEGALRRDQKLVPEIVIRELIANALIHQDFSLSGTSVMIEVYGGRVEISNPGTPIVPVERFIDGYQSRNERLADLMRRLGICEEKSSGIDKVVTTVEAYQLPAPVFTVRHQRTVVIIYGSRPFDEMLRDARIRACYQHAALRYVVSEPMTNRSLRERFGLHESKSASISQVIAATIEEGLIKQDETVGESRRMARYLPFWA